MDGTGNEGPAIPRGTAAPLVVVTGAGGFIGRHLVSALLVAGFRVRAVTREAAASGRHRPPSDAASAPQAEKVPHPGIGPEADWQPLLAGAAAVVHLAGMAHLPVDTREMRRRLRRVNVAATGQLARAAAEAGVSTFLFMSSIKAVSDHTDGTPLTETTPPRPEDCYGAAKLAAERRLQRIGRDAPAMRLLVLRPPLVYGPGAGANFAAFARLVATGLPLPFGAVLNCRSLLYVGNLADAVVRCLRRTDVPAGTFHLSDGAGVSTPGLAQAIAAAGNRRSRLFSVPPRWLGAAAAAAGRGDQMSRLTGSLEVGNHHFCRSFDWQPPFTLQQGLRATVDAMA